MARHRFARDPSAHADGWPDRRRRPTARLVVSSLLFMEALLAGGFAAWPPAGGPNWIPEACSGALFLISLTCLIGLRGRGRLGLLIFCITASWAIPLVMLASRELEASAVLWGTLITLSAVAAAFYLPPRVAVGQVLTMLVLLPVAALMFGPGIRLLYLVAIELSLLASAGGVGLLRHERDRALAALAALAVTDPLTGLLNRRGLEAEGVIVHANAVRSGQTTALAVIDIDGLKRVNDSQGHAAGDRLITSAAWHFRSHIREGDLLARVGGDEFVIVLPDADEGTAKVLLDRIREAGRAAWSFGCTAWAADESLEQAITSADARMYEEKAIRSPRRPTN